MIAHQVGESGSQLQPAMTRLPRRTVVPHDWQTRYELLPTVIVFELIVQFLAGCELVIG